MNPTKHPMVASRSADSDPTPAMCQPRRQLVSRSLLLSVAAVLGGTLGRTATGAGSSAPEAAAAAQGDASHAHGTEDHGHGAMPSSEAGPSAQPAPSAGNSGKDGGTTPDASPGTDMAPAKAASPVLLVLGDSLSAGYGLAQGEGWISLLEKRMKERAGQRRNGWQVVNASISGETTAGGRSRLADLLARHKPALVIIELGGNDALRGLPLKGATDNLREMLRAAQAAGAKTMLIGMQVPPNYGPAYANQFEQMYRTLANESQSALVPFLLAGFGDDPAWFQADGIHPNAAAQPKMLDNVWPVLEDVLVEARLQFLSRQAVC